MNTFFLVFALIALAPFVYHILVHGVKTPLPEAETTSGMLRVRYWPSVAFLLWIAFNALVLMSLLASPDAAFMHSVHHETLHYVLYTPIRIFAEFFG